MPIDRIVDTNAALGAYKNMSNITGRGQVEGDDTTETEGSAGGSGSGGGVRFSDFLQNKTRDAIETLKEGEAMSARAVTGEADLNAVVQAVTDAELTLQTVVAVRDRMISAYQEIMRMPI